MRRNLDNLLAEIKELEEKSKIIEGLDSKLNNRLILIHRQTLLTKTKTILNIIDLNARKRITEELFIQVSELNRPIIILDALQKYRFKLLTLQEIELNVNNIRPINLLNENRLTSYEEFKKRSELLLSMIENGGLDDCLQFSGSELLFRIMGENGELLERLGIDTSESYTKTRINQIINRKVNQEKRLRDLLNQIYEVNDEHL